MTPEYKTWLDSLQVGYNVLVLEDMNWDLAIKEIVNISPRRIIELKGWKEKFRNGRSKNCRNLRSISEFRRELIDKIESCEERNYRARLYRKFDDLEHEMKRKGIEIE